MILKYLPICLFVFNTAKAQTTLTSPEPASPALTTEEAQPFIPTLSNPEATSEAAPVPYYSNGESRAHFFSHLELGFYNRTMATYGKVDAAGGGSRYGFDLGVQYSLPCRHDGSSMIGASLGISWVTMKDNYGDKGPKGSGDNNYFMGVLKLPILYTTSFYRSEDEKGIYLQAGANIEYIMGGEINRIKADQLFSKVGFTPLVSIGYSAVYDYTSRTGKGGTVNMLLGPFFAYSALNVLNISGSSLRYMTFGITYTAIKL